MNKEFNRLVNQILEFRNKATPVIATILGVHKYDDKLDKTDPKSQKQYLKKLKEYLKKKEFHDKLISYGSIPVQMIRERIVGTL